MVENVCIAKLQGDVHLRCERCGRGWKGAGGNGLGRYVRERTTSRQQGLSLQLRFDWRNSERSCEGTKRRWTVEMQLNFCAERQTRASEIAHSPVIRRGIYDPTRRSVARYGCPRFRHPKICWSAPKETASPFANQLLSQLIYVHGTLNLLLPRSPCCHASSM